jgi:1,4-dihydroxy-6-naphthoate synthase
LQIRVGHSPDPDDAFMYWALTTDLVDTRGHAFEQVLGDIQTLNQWARCGRLEVTAISLAAYPFVQEDYALLPHGASIGSGYGPIVVARERMTLAELGKLEIVVPGTMTTSFLVLRLVLDEFSYRELPFDEIPDEVASGRADAGLLIHEGQLTYADTGLHLWTDLGAWWMEDTGLPLPLGGNAVRRNLGRTVIDQIARDLRASIVYALEHRAPALAHAKQFNRGIGDERTDAFVGMYVNEWTVDYGPRGRQAVQTLLDRGHAAGLIPEEVTVEFVG